MSDFRMFALAVVLTATALHVSLAVYKSHQGSTTMVNALASNP